jgi:hypothetical protein
MAGRVLDLDWRKIARREPPMWPGSLSLYSPAEARRETRRLGVEGLFFIGTNLAGVLFALDVRKRVVLVDEVEREPCVIVAKDFDRFARAFVTDMGAVAALRKKDADQGVARRWKKLAACLGEPHAMKRAMETWALLVDIANAHLVDGRHGELLASWSAFRKQHPSRTALLDKKLRAYVARWGKR